MSVVRSAQDVMDGDLVLYEGDLWEAIDDAGLDGDTAVLRLRNDNASATIEWQLGKDDEVTCE